MGFINCYYIHPVESSEDSVIELLEEFNATDFEKLEAAAIEVGILTNTHLETFEDAANNVKKRQIILNALKSVCKSQLIHFTGLLATQGFILFYQLTSNLDTCS